MTTWFSPDSSNVTWNDHYPNASGRYIVEWETNPAVREPNTALLVATGLGSLGWRPRRRQCESIWSD